jgi:hypothetical protein
VIYVRVRDPQTRHEYDMPSTHPHITRGLVIPLDSRRWPPVAVPRPPKHHVELTKLAVPSAATRARRPATRNPAPRTEEPS